MSDPGSAELYGFMQHAKFVTGNVRKHEVRRGVCMLWAASSRLSNSVYSCVSSVPLRSTPQRIRSVSCILEKAKIKREGAEASLSDCSADVTPVKRKEERRRIL